MRNNSEESVIQALDGLYEKAVKGIYGFESAEALANHYLKKSGNLDQNIDALIRRQKQISGTCGFLGGLGGFPVLLVSMPANMVSVMFLQIRMIAAIACMRGYNLEDDRIKTFVILCLAGNAAKDIMKGAGITFGKALTRQVLNLVTGSVVKQINRMLGVRLLGKLGQKGAASIGKAVPLVGGAIGAYFDASLTQSIGMLAKEVFPYCCHDPIEASYSIHDEY